MPNCCVPDGALALIVKILLSEILLSEMGWNAEKVEDC